MRSPCRGRSARCRRAEAPIAASAAWGGFFHAMVVSVPEHRRGFRDGLRRAVAIAGYRYMRPGLLIAPSDRRAEIAPVLDRTPKDASILFAELRLSAEDSRAVATELWGLDELAHRYRALAVAAREATATARRHPPTGPEALRALATATLPIYQAIRDDPGVPPQLLAPDWPQPELRASLGGILECLMPAVRHYIDQLRGHRSPTR